MPEGFDLVCLSHLRWDFVYQRPQQILSRFARNHRVFFVEEPLLTPGTLEMEVKHREANLWTAVPHLPAGLSDEQSVSVQRQLLGDLLLSHSVERFVLWYYTPIALAFTDHLTPVLAVYDCMDDLSAFIGAPSSMQAWERKLLDRVHLVFTAGPSMQEEKAKLHSSVYMFPGSVDVAQFARARTIVQDPADQSAISRPRIGFYAVLDDRIDFNLIAELADAKSSWSIIAIGPVLKIEPATLPRRPNIYYLGMKALEDLPVYMAGWDVAILPFLRNRATRFINPNKLPEYLAAGKPIISTSIQDVLKLYASRGLVRVADTSMEMIKSAEAAMQEDVEARWRTFDRFLSTTSWEDTCQGMLALIDTGIREQCQRK